ncbi:exportin-4 isoform X1 [Chlorella sorokiniana]|uniref:Exportin-4 n=1 Tax=Chlorella sorokiniana TaxID=3076 RepID=A0A2P6TNP5_CHLSO|nr:exportin-4 isoform X1 [Chlorella sorokiniana]|eukprot:PRW50955.1 exportin-4 isoform X1 [Chlorella sorokiniana]
MDPAAAQFVQACAGLHNPATRTQAEAALLEFRRSAGVEACVAILQQSSDEGVQFQAVLALREILLSRWALLGQQTQQATLQFLLGLALGPLAADPRPLLRTQVSATVAAIIKRGWLEGGQAERDAALHGIHAQASQAGSMEARRVGLELLTAVVEEFSPSTASQMGLSWELHEQCRSSLEQGYLHGLLQHAQASARDAASAAASGADAGVCIAALHLLGAILSWPFSSASNSEVWRVLDSGRPAFEATSLRPPAAWAEALLAQDAWAWLAPLTQARGQPQVEAAVQRAAEGLCGLSGPIFGPDQQAGRAELGLPTGPNLRQQHLLAMLQLVLPWVTPAGPAIDAARQSAAGGEERLLSACRCLLAAARVHRSAGFDAASAALGLPAGRGGLLGLLSELTTAVLAAAGADPGWWEGEASELLLEMWVELVADPCRGPMGGSQSAVAAAAAVFAAVVESGLQQAAAEAQEDEEENEGGENMQTEEWLAKVAALGRASAALSLPRLAERLGAALAALQQCMQSGADPSVALEQLCWLTTMCSHVLADLGEGETPLVPLPICQACESAAAAAAADPAEQLSAGLLAVGSHCMAHVGQVAASPRLVEVAAASLARWADTYLMPQEAPGSPALAAAFGAGSPGGGQAAQLLVSLVLAGLTGYPGERALHEVVCGQLLHALVRRPAVCAALLDSPAWGGLCDAVGRGDAGLLQLAEKVQRRLLQSLLLAAHGLPGDAGNWAGHLLESTAAQLRQAGGSEAAARAALQRADGLHLVVSLLERLRGAVRGTIPATQAALFQQFTSVAPALATLFDACRTQPVAVTLILKLAGDVVEAHAAYLSLPDAQALCAWALRLLQLYSAHNLGQVSVAASKALAAEALSDRYLDLRALLKLLTKLTQADWANQAPVKSSASAAAGAGGDREAVDVAQIVFAGLDIIVPLLSPELLKFPKLCRAYFALLAHMLEVYPERMAVLPPSVFQTLVSTLQFGVGATGDDEVTQAVFEAAAALARFHVQSVAAGGPGLGANNAPGPDGTTPLGGVLAASLQRLIHGDAGLEAVDHAAEAVLPLALSDPPALQRSGEALLAACTDGAAKASAQAALTSLVASVGGAASLDRPSRRAFSRALSKFVTDMRGAVNVR